MNNYTVYHLHSDMSNGVTNIDSVTKFSEYIDLAKTYGMNAIAFSEHGSVFAWDLKKEAVEKAGMKYIHAEEFYVTQSLSEKKRDNYHCVLIAKNWEGVKEINKLASSSFNRNDGHFYYVPRITVDELFSISDNIIMTTACLGGIMAKSPESLQSTIINFMIKHRENCFLEIQHHNVADQIEYNKKMFNLSKTYGLRLIAGTDTHCLNESHAKGRSILQKAKKTYFENEEGWDLVFKSYDELVDAYKKQASLPESVYMEAIENTNVMANMIEEFELDRGTKYPHIYDNPVETFKQKINNGYKKNKYIKDRYSKKEIAQRVNDELAVYEKVGAIDFMLLESYIKEWEEDNGIMSGYGRGSVSGSLVAYLLGITQMDSLKFDLNFFRFMNPSRVSNADIDTDYCGKDRDKIKYFLLHDRLNLPNIKTAEIITFNTIAMKGAIKDVCRALNIDLSEAQEISDAVQLNENKQWVIDNSYREKYKELFEYVDIVNGTIVSIGTHPSGVLVSDKNIEEIVGLCSISTSDYPVSMLDMHGLDGQMFVKLDILGLDNIGVINDCCKLVGIDRLTPDNTDLNDENVWNDIKNDTTMIFQWESDSAQDYLKRFMSDKTLRIAKEHNSNFSYIKWFSFGNGLIRPGCASFRDEVADGKVLTTGFKELDNFLSVTFGRIVMQEDIMRFCKQFCGYSDAESDNVRRCVDENTLIMMGDGTYKKIKDIRIGDFVMSFNDVTGCNEPQKVTNVFNNGIKDVVRLKTSNIASLVATPSHKVYVGNGFKNIGDLNKASDIVYLSSIIHGEIRPAQIDSITPHGLSHVYDIEVENNHNYYANGILVHNCIAKKKGTEGLLGELHDRFVEHSSKTYGVNKDLLEEIFPPIRQGILDASSYAFSWNHSDAYSCIGYISGYLRHYYPLEFITAAFNIFTGKEDKITAITEYSKKHGISIRDIKFGHSKAEYNMDKSTNSIYKGMESIKYLNSEVSNKLYEMSKNPEYKDFINILRDFPGDSRQREILIKLGYFSDFGTVGHLLSVVDIFDKFNNRKQVQKDAICLPENIISEYCSETPKMYQIKDWYGLVHRMSEMQDVVVDKTFSVRDLCEAEYEFLGYISFKDPSRVKQGYVCDINLDKSPKITMYMIDKGLTKQFKMYKKQYAENPFDIGDLVSYGITSKQKTRYNSETKEFVKIQGEYEEWISWINIKDKKEIK